MAETPEQVQQLPDDLVPAATAKADAEAARIQALIDAAARAASSSSRGTGSSTRSRCARPIRPRRRRDQAVLRARSRARRTASSSPRTSSTASRSRNATTSGLSAGRARLRGVRRRRHVARRFFTATTSNATTRTAARGWTPSSISRRCSAPSRSSTTSRNFAKPAPGQPALLSFDDVHDDVPRVRPRAARAVLEREVPDAVGHRRAARLRGVPVAVQRALGARAHRVRQLRASTTRRASRCRRSWSTKIKKSAEVRPGLRAHRVPGGRRCSTWPGTRCRRTAGDAGCRCFEAEALTQLTSTSPLVPPRYRTSYFAPHLGQRLRRRLLRVPVDRVLATTRSTGSRNTAA